jgi:mono/diheme cytochrome c family protein
VTPAKIDGATIAQLLENLKLPEYRARYRTRTELRKFDSAKVNSALMSWLKKLKTNDSKYDNYLLEALLVTFSSDHPSLKIHKLAMESKNFNLRSVAVRALAQTPLAFNKLQEILNKTVKDPHGRVRLEALVVASQLSNRLDLNATLGQLPNDQISKDAQLSPVITTLRTLASNQTIRSKKDKINVPKHLKGNDIARFNKGHEVYHREAHCATCHQEDGEGLPAAMFPPLTSTKWVLEDQERLIKLVIHGLHGPMKIKEKQYPGLVPMSGFKALTDQEIADVLTFVRNSFGNQASSVSPDLVKKVRAETSDQEGFFAPKELLKQHPHKK